MERLQGILESKDHAYRLYEPAFLGLFPKKNWNMMITLSFRKPLFVSISAHTYLHTKDLIIYTAG